MNKLRVTVTIEDNNGNAVVTSESARNVPAYNGFEEQGFRKAFGILENAMLDARKEASDAAIEQYIGDASKKNN